MRSISRLRLFYLVNDSYLFKKGHTFWWLKVIQSRTFLQFDFCTNSCVNSHHYLMPAWSFPLIIDESSLRPASPPPSTPAAQYWPLPTPCMEGECLLAGLSKLCELWLHFSCIFSMSGQFVVGLVSARKGHCLIKLVLYVDIDILVNVHVPKDNGFWTWDFV